MPLALASASLAAFLAATAATTPEPPRFPDIDYDTARPALAVATLARGGEYFDAGCPDVSPQVPGENGEMLDTICIDMDPPPFWLQATNVTTLLGPAMPERTHVATTSHYGMPEEEDLAGRRWLLRLVTDGEDFELRRYQRAPLTDSRWGEPYLLLYEPHPPDWLPCSVESLREEIAASDFPAEIVVAREFLNQGEDETNSPHLRFTPQGFLPRYGIALARLRTHLAAMEATHEDVPVDCDPAQGDR